MPPPPVDCGHNADLSHACLPLCVRAQSKEALSPKEALAALERERLLVEEERKLKKEYAEKREVQAAEEAIADAFAKEAQEVADGATSAAAVEAEVVARLSREQVREIAHAVGTLSAKSALEEERNEMSALEAERLSAATSIEAAKLQTYQVRLRGMLGLSPVWCGLRTGRGP